MMILITIFSVLALAIAIVALFLSLLVVAAVNNFKREVGAALLNFELPKKHRSSEHNRKSVTDFMRNQ